MFFIISKLLSFLIQPITWLISTMGWGFMTKNAVKKRKILRGLFWGIVVLTNPFLMNQTYRFYETPAVPMASLRDTFDVGIVLGGFSTFDVPANDRLNFNFAGNRLLDALVLYKKGLIRKILITGGDGDLLGDESLEADAAAPFLEVMGVRKEDILLENRARNTHENALFSKQLLENHQINTSKILLITSAYHMPRAAACFRKVGLDALPFPAHFIGEKPSWETTYWIFPNSKAIFYWKEIIKEWFGCVAYALKGYI
jgi:uncharacterized SAM-binding protein YcdF (DUF218 family)